MLADCGRHLTGWWLWGLHGLRGGRPDQDGNREDVRWLRLGNGDVTLGARMTGAGGEPEPFSLTAKHYMDSDLEKAMLPHELQKVNATVLNLDL